MPVRSLGGLDTFNMQHGFVEAIIRGFRSGFLGPDTYNHLSQCENLEVRKYLSASNKMCHYERPTYMYAYICTLVIIYVPLDNEKY